MADKYRAKVFFNNGIIAEFTGNELDIEPNDGLYIYKDGILTYGIPMRNILYYELQQEEFQSPEEEKEEEDISQSHPLDNFGDWWDDLTSQE